MADNMHKKTVVKKFNVNLDLDEQGPKIKVSSQTSRAIQKGKNSSLEAY